ncbi:hypothetical protein ElyMa_003307400 [Elysia marginata]|uniref:Uncharacterized protein n=1 Tax=Elysia marginata TaxID=1093978 RepID=A0AAV4JDR3_9GAST|nr:hypothetical protein ElyMa_003307400 [Elysia marginata]
MPCWDRFCPACPGARRERCKHHLIFTFGFTVVASACARSLLVHHGISGKELTQPSMPGHLCGDDSDAVGGVAQTFLLDGVEHPLVEHQDCADEKPQGRVDDCKDNPEDLENQGRYMSVRKKKKLIK